jgi:P4 family phage/plasmid primase-like protien
VHRSNSPRINWPEIEAAIYAGLGLPQLVTEYKTIGVQFERDEPKSNGMIPCYSCLREEADPSAYVNANTGRYKDSGSDDAHEIHIWELAARKGMWGGDWKAARSYYAQLAGVEIPAQKSPATRKPKAAGRRSPKKAGQKQPGIARAAGSGLRGNGDSAAAANSATPNQPPAPAEDWRTALHFEPWTDGRLLLLASWCKRHKPGVTPAAFLAAGGRFARYRKSGVNAETNEPWEREWSVYCLPVYGESILQMIQSTAAPTDEQLDTTTTAWVCWSRNPIGDPLTRWDARTKSAVPIKMKAIGSTDGVMNRGAILKLAAHRHDPASHQIHGVWKVEGPTDLLALYSSIADAHTIATHPIISFAGTATQCNAWQVELFRGLPQADVIHDADAAGQAGAKKVCRALAGVVGKVVFRELPGPVAAKHGLDLRDWLNAGNQYFDVCALNQWEEAWVDDGAAISDPSAADVDSPAVADGSDDSTTDDETITPSIFDPNSLTCEAGRTEAASARRFVNAYPNELRYCQPWKSWFFWDGKRWKCDKECHVQGLAKAYAEALWEEITDLQTTVDDATAKELERFAKRSNSKLAIENIMSLARSEPGVPVLVDQFDRQHTLLNVENGVLNLETGELTPHDPALMLSKLAPVAYDPAAECPTWIRFIAEITAPVDDPASLPPPEDAGDAYEPPAPPSGITLKEYLQRIMGWCLTGLIRNHAMMFFHGKGSNGKSTLINVMLDLLGPDYAIKTPPEFIMVRAHEAHPTERADLFGKRMVITTEVEEGRRLAESLVKDLTGSDPIRARRMHEDFWEFRPTHKLIVAGNHKPIVKGTDEGIWRRIKLVPFSRIFEDGQKDETLPERLTAELPGILNWCLAGCQAWLREGLCEPEIVADATKKYRDEQDVFGNFLLERCIIATWPKVRSQTLFNEYSKWCEQAGERTMTMKKFSQAVIADPRFERRVSNGVWYHGIGLRDEAHSDRDAPDNAHSDTENDTNSTAHQHTRDRKNQPQLPL